MKKSPCAVAAATAMATAMITPVLAAAGGTSSAGVSIALDPSGILATVDVDGPIRTDSAFFQSLGTNGRSCSSCHVASQAFSMSAAAVRNRFLSSHGQDPLFAAVDGANCSNAAQGDPREHSLILQSGLIRIALPLPNPAEFTISVVHDPYGCAMQFDPASRQTLISVYRRPLPTTNLGFLSAVMFDGRETIAPLTDATTFLANLTTDLRHQAIDATNGHAQAAHPPTDAQVADIVSFELGLFTAQWRDSSAGVLAAAGAQGGPGRLSQELYYPGINDSLGGDPSGTPFDARAMTLFDAWASLVDDGRDGYGDSVEARRAIAAGEELFNSAPIQITNVRGLNDNAAIGRPDSFVGHCTSCHDTPSVGNHSLPLPLDIGTSHAVLPGMESDPAIAAGLAQLSMPDLPVYLVSGCPNPFAASEPESFYTSDPGKALITGKCADFNRTKGPILRGLAARAPYFHNGAAASLEQLVDFYNERFTMGLTDTEKAELVAFLNSL
jgi:cytochrome c peroxidase